MAKFLRVLVIIAVAFATPFVAWAETTYASANMTNRRWQDATGQYSDAFITADVEISFNGSPSYAPFVTTVTHAAGASKGQVQTAVRLVVNEWLAIEEPGNTLNNAHILLGGLSD
jgi:hypothetical protein